MIMSAGAAVDTMLSSTVLPWQHKRFWWTASPHHLLQRFTPVGKGVLTLQGSLQTAAATYLQHHRIDSMAAVPSSLLFEASAATAVLLLEDGSDESSVAITSAVISNQCLLGSGSMLSVCLDSRAAAMEVGLLPGDSSAEIRQLLTAHAVATVSMTAAEIPTSHMTDPSPVTALLLSINKDVLQPSLCAAATAELHVQDAWASGFSLPPASLESLLAVDSCWGGDMPSAVIACQLLLCISRQRHPQPRAYTAAAGRASSWAALFGSESAAAMRVAGLVLGPVSMLGTESDSYILEWKEVTSGRTGPAE